MADVHHPDATAAQAGSNQMQMRTNDTQLADYIYDGTTVKNNFTKKELESNVEGVSLVKIESDSIKVENYKNLSSNNIIDKQTLELMLENFHHKNCDNELDISPIEHQIMPIKYSKIRDDLEKYDQKLDIKEEETFQVLSYEAVVEDAEIKMDISNQNEVLKRETLSNDQTALPATETNLPMSSAMEQSCSESRIRKSPKDQSEEKCSETKQLFLDVKHVQAISETISFDHKKVQTSYSRGRKKNRLGLETKDNLFSCQRCSQTFITELSLKEHQEQHLYDDEYPYKCKDCSKPFQIEYALKKHEAKHLQDMAVKTLNQSASKMSDDYNISETRNESEDDLNDQNDRSSIGDKNATDRIQNDRDSNKKTHKEFYCEICEKTFRDNYAKKVHNRTHEKPFACKLCQKTFSIKRSLQLHYKMHLHYHDQTLAEAVAGLFLCEYCKREFGTKAALTSHRKTHL